MLIVHKLRQSLNNFRFGENDRSQNRGIHLRAMPFEQRLLALTLVSPDVARVWGIDISLWDGNVDLAVTKSRGASFVFIKALDGTIQTKYFPENRARAIAADLPHGPYGWLYRDVNVRCAAQAQAYNDIVQRYPPVMPPVIDFEWTRYAGVQSNPDYTDLRKWVTEWLRLGNPKPLLYSAAGYMNPFGSIPADLKAMFHGIWIANYGVNNPAMPYGYAVNEWEFHQFTASGDATLIAPNDVNKKELDLNYFNGSGEVFEQRYLGGTTPPPDGGTMEEYKIVTAGLKIRTAPPVGSVLGPDAGKVMLRDDLIHVSAKDIASGWLRIAKWVKSTGGDVYPPEAVQWWCSGLTSYVQFVRVISEPPPPDPEPEPPTSDIAGVRFTGEVIFDFTDGRQDVWHVTDVPFEKGPA